MKKLIVMRHAKSDWSDSSLRDMERPLNNRGRKDAPRMGKALADRGHSPDLILLSPAERTNLTAEGIVKSLEENIPGEFIESFYPGRPDVFEEALEEYADRAETILILAHNPGIEQFVMQLCGSYHRMPTAAAAVFDCRGDDWQLIEILSPKDL